MNCITQQTPDHSNIGNKYKSIIYFYKQQLYHLFYFIFKETKSKLIHFLK